MIANSELLPTSPPKIKLKRGFFLLIMLGLSVYFLLPQVARIEQALRVASTLQTRFVALSLIAQVFSYLGSGYLLRAVVKLGAKLVSVVEGALVTVGANSVGTLGGGVLGTAGMTYFWLRKRGANAGSAGLGGWIPIILNDAVLAIVSLVGLLTLVLLEKFSRLLVLGFVIAVMILAGSIGTLLWSLTHREKLMPLAMAISAVSELSRQRWQHYTAFWVYPPPSLLLSLFIVFFHSGCRRSPVLRSCFALSIPKAARIDLRLPRKAATICLESERAAGRQDCPH